jgi:hypothetical protein
VRDSHIHPRGPRQRWFARLVSAPGAYNTLCSAVEVECFFPPDLIISYNKRLEWQFCVSRQPDVVENDRVVTGSWKNSADEVKKIPSD